MIGIKSLKVSEENILNIITPPRPVWTVDTRQVGSMNSCCWHQILTLPVIKISQSKLHFSSIQLPSFVESVSTVASVFCCWLTEVEPDMVFCCFAQM